MSYLQTDRYKRAKYKKPWLLAVIIGAVLIIAGTVFSDGLVSGTIWLRELMHVQNKDRSVINGERKSADYLKAKIIALESENSALRNILNSESSRTAGSSTGSTPALIVTMRPRGQIFSVISRPPFSPYDTLIVSGGQKDGIVVGSLVFASPDVLVGTVTAVLSNSSIVTLYSSSGQKQEVYIGTSTAAVISEGFGGGNFHIKLPSESKIKLGDPIIWPAMNNVLLGRVEKIDSSPGDAFLSLFFKSLIPINQIRYVEILSDNI